MTSELPNSFRGLRQRELCDRSGWDYREVAQTARQLGLSTHAYLQQKTGWRLQNERYYPPEGKKRWPNSCFGHPNRPTKIP